jgi:hypothetical protein
MVSEVPANNRIKDCNNHFRQVNADDTNNCRARQTGRITFSAKFFNLLGYCPDEREIDTESSEPGTQVNITVPVYAE